MEPMNLKVLSLNLDDKMPNSEEAKTCRETWIERARYLCDKGEDEEIVRMCLVMADRTFVEDSEQIYYYIIGAFSGAIGHRIYKIYQEIYW